MQNQTFKLSLKPNDYPPNVPFVYADQYDVGRVFAATVYDADGSLYNFNGETVTVVGTKPSGTGFSYPATASGNTVTFETTGQMTVVAGNVTCGIIIEQDGDRIGTLHFVLHVQPAALSADTIIDSDDFGSIISDAVAEYMEEHGIVIDDTLTVAGAAADAKATGDAIDELKSAFDSYIYGLSESFPVATASQSYTFSVPFIKGKTYLITNNTSASCTMTARQTDGTSTSLSANLASGANVAFTPTTEDYVEIRGWMNGTGTINVVCTYSNLEDVDSKAGYGYVQSVANGVDETFTVSVASRSSRFSVALAKGGTYTYTNNTSAAQTLNGYKKDGTYTSLNAQLTAGASHTFTASEDYVAIGGYFNGTGTVRVVGEGLSGSIEAIKNGVAANKSDVILGHNTSPVVNVDARTVSWSAVLYLNTVAGRFSVAVADVATQIPTYATYDANTTTVTVTLPNECVLVFRVSENTLKVINRNRVALDDVILFGEYYKNDYGLLWDKYWRDLYITDHNNGIVNAVDVFNAEPFTGTYDWQTPVVAYGALFKGKENVDSFAFFTDPHIMGWADDNRNEVNMKNYLKRVQKVYNASPCSFIVSGGDWLNNTTTMDEACYRLGYLKGIAKHLLDGCYLVNGNHDTNYQGKLDSESENYTGQLSNETIAALLFRDTDTKKAYYSFEADIAKCYVLDTGVEHDTMLAYDWEQVAWLAGKLAQDDPEHAIMFIHIITSSGAVQTNASNFGSLVEAYNNHTTVTLNGTTYNFTGCTGHVDFWMAGHTHSDSNGTLGGIPYIITGSNAASSDVPMIDLVMVDYDANEINLVRAGTGNNRTISF